MNAEAKKTQEQQVQSKVEKPKTVKDLSPEGRQEAFKAVKPKTGPHIKEIEGVIKPKKSQEGLKPGKENKEQISEEIKGDLEVFRNSGNITAVELGDRINERIAEIGENKENISASDYEKIKEEVIKSLDSQELNDIFQKRIDKLNLKLKDKDGNQLDKTLYEALKEKDQVLGKALENFENQELAQKALATYGPEKLKAINPILEQLKKDGKEIPDDLEQINELIVKKLAEQERKRLAKEDPEKKPDDKVLEQAVKEMMSHASPEAIAQTVNDSGSSGRNIDFQPGNAMANSAELQKAIESLPDGKAKKMLETAKKYLGYNEKDPKQRAELKSFLGFDPASTPWCKGFVNAVCKKAGISLNSAGSLAARSGEQDGRKLKIPGEKPMPGDLVVVERKGKTTSGTPGGHIGIFIGMSPEGSPIIIGGNQGNRVSIKTERRPIISINRVVPDEDVISKNNSGDTSGNKTV